jgi:hypothetical protein
MSCLYPAPVVIPPPIGLQEQLHQNCTTYFNYRSFQQNWTVSSIIHVPLYQPGGSSVIAGEHYFEWRSAGSTLPVVSVCFVIAPIFEHVAPINLKFPSTQFDRTLIIICCHWVPKELPHFVLEEIELIEDLNLYRLDTLVHILEDFIKDFHCPLTNLNFTPPTDPLENHQ